MSHRALAVAFLLIGACTTVGGADGEEVAATDVAGMRGATSADGPPPVPHLLGRVIDGEGRPVRDATVAIAGATTLTAHDGWFDLPAPAAGTVSVSKPGWGRSEVAWDGRPGFVEASIEPLRVRGLRVNGTAAGDDAEFAELLRLAEETAINALVFDTKQEGGKVLYDTSVRDAHSSGAAVSAYDPAERIAQAEEHGLYVVTRIVTFEDWFRAESHPDEALGGPWLDPTNRDAWDYPLALAEEACLLGFDEIQFDYVRFPSGAVAESSGQLEMTQAERVAAIQEFLIAARELLHPMGCALSADVFGIVVTATNDQGIGQRPEEMSRQVDAFSPMVYPSHYSDGWLGFPDPNDHPYDVTSDAIEDGLRRMEPGTVLRPWLQGFWWTDEQVRRSIQAAEDHDVGWILWNAVSNFSRASLPTDAEVAG